MSNEENIEDAEGLIYGSFGSEQPTSREQGTPAVAFAERGSKEWQEQQRQQAAYRQGLSNAGAYDEMLGREPDAEFHERPERVTERMLVGSGRPRGGSGGGGGKGRKAPRKKAPPKGYNDRRDDEGADARKAVPRMCINGLSLGETEYFHSHPGEARATLARFADDMMDTGTVLAVAVPPQHTKNTKKNFEVWGLTRPQIDALRSTPGLAARKLRAHAWEKAADRIRMRDAAAPKSNCT